MEEKNLREKLLIMIQEADDEEIAVIHRLVFVFPELRPVLRSSLILK